MIVSNYWKWLNSILTTNPTSDSYYDPVSDIGLKDKNGSAVSITLSSSDATRRYRVRNFNDGTIWLGSGNDEIAATDYAMSNDCTASISNLNFTINSAGTDEGLSRTIAVTGTNNSGNTITITEVGYAKYIEAEQAGNAFVLFSKTKLAEPLTVTDGSNFIINIAWEEN